MFVQDLNSLKYHELQKLAKGVGIRANQKIEKLIIALSAHYVETESEKQVHVESSSEGKISSSKKNITKKGIIDSPCSSSTIAKSTPLVLDGKKPLPPNGAGGRKRRNTFELDEPSLQNNTPNIEGQTKNQTRQRPSQGVSAGSEKRTYVSQKQRRIICNKDDSTSIPQSDVIKLQTPTQVGGRKRRRTFELDEATVQGNTPTIDDQSEKQTIKRTSQEVFGGPENCVVHVTKRQRKSLSNNNSTSSNDSSSSTQAIIEAMNANLSSSERRKMLLAAITKKVQKTVSSTNSAKTSQLSQIPRLTTIPVNKKKEGQKAVTPGSKNWKKIHTKEFSKFDSIDVYLEKRKNRQDQLSSSAKKPMPFGSPVGKVKPVIVKPVNRNSGRVKVFQPQVTSTKNINFNFTRMASAKKTPSKRPIVTPKVATSAISSKTPLQSIVHNKATAAKATPFKFTGNTSSINEVAPAKNAFDLKASLARPMTWKPHVGKLQRFDGNKEQTVQVTKPKGSMAHRALASKTRTAEVKKKVHRTAVMDRRSNQKYVDMMKKRGLL